MRLLLALLLTAAAGLAARVEYRAFWVDTFNTPLNNHADIEAVVNRARAANTNALFVQVRRRGDAWYVNSVEPAPDFLPIAPAFDPLYDLIQTAHAANIEVHAFVILGAIWNKNPTFPASATLGPPASPLHVFNRHSGFNPATGRIEPNADTWLTRSLLPDGTAGITFQGHRFGAEFWLDFGHPNAAAHAAEVTTHLVRNYDIDGIHLDRIRFPEFAATGQTPATGANIGYNAVSVWRFQEFHGISHDEPPPAPGDPLWAQWRRDQVTNVVRRIYLNAVAVRPRIVVSAALIVYGGGPASTAAWTSSEAYWRVYQDWRAWLEEGIIDLAIPMNYKRDNVPQQAQWFDQWNAFTRNHQYNRAALTGLGIYLNPIDDTLSQIRRSLETTPTGVSLYALANPDSAPSQGFDAFARALTGSVFAEPAILPRLPWKTNPSKGHLMGTTPFDSAAVYLYNSAGELVKTTRTDGSGFYGAVDLPPGEYALIIEKGADRRVVTGVNVNPGQVTEVQ